MRGGPLASMRLMSKRMVDVNQSDRPPEPISMISAREVAWTSLLLVLLVGFRAVLNSPPFSLLRWYVAQLGEGARLLIGQPSIEGDIAGNFAQARAVIDPDFRAYDRLVDIFPLIGVEWSVGHGHPRLPMEIPLYVPALALGHESLIYQAIAYALPVMSLLALAWSLRFMNIPLIAAWAAAMVLVVAPIGPFVLESTYPFVALSLALAWRFRDRPVIAALGIVLAGAGRGLALFPLLYFALTRRWRTVVMAVITLGALLGVAVALEPSVLSDFMGRGLDWGEQNAARDDNASLAAALIRPVYAYVLAAGIFALTLRRLETSYWSFVWLSAALAPIAWTYAAVALLPLGAYIWFKGAVCRVLVLIAALALLANGSYSGMSYAVATLALGVGLVLATWGPDQSLSGGQEEPSDPRAKLRI
mgnify:CR=1 FL=1